ncbi:MAG: hypothetical protein OXC07_06770 [Kistimonas sp.]|nr:hypothetical protein [Kistimonas sp.]
MRGTNFSWHQQQHLPDYAEDEPESLISPFVMRYRFSDKQGTSEKQAASRTDARA